MYSKASWALLYAQSKFTFGSDRQPDNQPRGKRRDEYDGLKSCFNSYYASKSGIVFFKIFVRFKKKSEDATFQNNEKID